MFCHRHNNRGKKEFVLNKLWELITISIQWTEYIETLLDKLSINGLNRNAQLPPVIDVATKFPFRCCDIPVPTDSSGYVYMLVSARDFDRDYIGQTQNLSKRVEQHFHGHGSLGTCDPYYHPYILAASICGMSHMEERERKHLEQR